MLSVNGITNMGRASGPVEQSFVDELRALRGDMSQRELARLTHYSAGHHSNVETGIKPPTEDFARACDMALGTGGRLVALLLRSAARSRHKVIRPAQLPPAPFLVGRIDLLCELDRLLDRKRSSTAPCVIALDGQAGVGKTTVAVAWAHRIKDRFPDGVIFVDLNGYTATGHPADPAAVVEDVLKALGVPSADIPDTLDRRAASLRTLLDGTRTLLVLDNAALVDQVRHLIPAAPDCLVVTTSRRRLSGLAVHHGARCLTVSTFPQAEAIALLRNVVGGDRVDAEQDAAERVVAFCGGLPLAVRVAAERIAASLHLTLAGLADDLAGADHRLDVLSPHDADEAVRAVFSWSFRALEHRAARLFRLLSLHPTREFGVGAASALTGYEPADTACLLDLLAGVHLIEEAARRRYRFHDLLRAYACERVRAEESLGDKASAARRLLYWYLHAAAAANLAMSPNRPQVDVPGPELPADLRVPTFGSADEAVLWCETELANLAAATAHAAKLGVHDVAFGLPIVLSDYLYRRNPWHTWIGPLETCLTEARHCGDTVAQAWILNNLGNAHLERRWLDHAARCYGEALALREHDNDRDGLIWSHIGVGRVRQATGDPKAATDHFHAALALSRELDQRWAQGIVTAYLGDAHRAVGNHRQALSDLHDAARTLRDLGDHQSESCALDKVCDVHRDLGEHDAALDYLNRALAASAAATDRWGQAELLRKLGHLHHRHGREDPAREAWTQALELFEALADPRAAGIRADLDALAHKTVPTPRAG